MRKHIGAVIIGVGSIVGLAVACAPPTQPIKCVPPAYQVGDACLIPPASTTP